jgi:transcriptional regulator
MHVPEAFAPRDAEEALDAVERYPFGVLVTAPTRGAPIATHLPFLLDRPAGGPPTLLGHLARANPQWRQWGDGVPALVVFSGPNGYVSSTWYVGDDGVPTWNYLAVHLTGTVVLRDEASFALSLLARTVARFEGPESGTRLDTDSDYIRNLARGVVAFSMPVDRVDAIFKLSQNVPPDEQERVMHGLAQRGTPADLAVVAEMRRALRGG